MRHYIGLPVVSLLTAVACSGGIDGARATLPALGSRAPAFAYPRTDAGTLGSTELLGAPAVLALWSSTCSASLEALSAIVALQAELAPLGVKVILLADDAELGTLAHLQSTFGALPVGHAAGKLKDVWSQTHLGPWRRGLGLPSFLVLDRASTVRYTQVGIEQARDARLAALRRQVDLVIAEPGL